MGSRPQDLGALRSKCAEILRLQVCFESAVADLQPLGLASVLAKESLMAQLPCTACKRRTPYRNSGAYCHLWGPGPQQDFRLRLCPAHTVALQNDLAEQELAPINDTPSIVHTPTECFSCGKPVDEIDWHLSVTAYPAKDKREDYWTRLHIDCTLPEWALNGQPLL